MSQDINPLLDHHQPILSLDILPSAATRWKDEVLGIIPGPCPEAGSIRKHAPRSKQQQFVAAAKVFPSRDRQGADTNPKRNRSQPLSISFSVAYKQTFFWRQRSSLK